MAWDATIAFTNGTVPVAADLQDINDNLDYLKGAQAAQTLITIESRLVAPAYHSQVTVDPSSPFEMRCWDNSLNTNNKIKIVGVSNDASIDNQDEVRLILCLEDQDAGTTEQLGEISWTYLGGGADQGYLSFYPYYRGQRFPDSPGLSITNNGRCRINTRTLFGTRSLSVNGTVNADEYRDSSGIIGGVWDDTKGSKYFAGDADIDQATSNYIINNGASDTWLGFPAAVPAIPPFSVHSITLGTNEMGAALMRGHDWPASGGAATASAVAGTVFGRQNGSYVWGPTLSYDNGNRNGVYYVFASITAIANDDDMPMYLWAYEWPNVAGKKELVGDIRVQYAGKPYQIIAQGLYVATGLNESGDTEQIQVQVRTSRGIITSGERLGVVQSGRCYAEWKCPANSR